MKQSHAKGKSQLWSLSHAGNMSCLRRSTDDKADVSEQDCKGLSCVEICLRLLQRNVDSLLLCICSCSNIILTWVYGLVLDKLMIMAVLLCCCALIHARLPNFHELDNTAVVAAFAGCLGLCCLSHGVDSVLLESWRWLCAQWWHAVRLFIHFSCCYPVFFNIEILLCCAVLCCAVLG